MSNVSEFSSYNATTVPPTPQGSSGGGMGSLFSNPKVLLLVLGGLVVLFLFLKSRGSNNADSGYPVGQPNLPSGDTATQPPANTSDGPVIQSFGDGIVACDSINGCQYFDHPQSQTTVAPASGLQPPQTTTPTQTTTPITPTPAPQPITVNVPSPIIQVQTPSPVPTTVTHPVVPPAPSPAVVHAATVLGPAAATAIASAFAGVPLPSIHPPVAPPRVPATSTPLHTAPARPPARPPTRPPVTPARPPVNRVRAV